VRRFIAFLTNMDARARRSVAVTLLLFGVTGVLFVIGGGILGPGEAMQVRGWLAAAHGPWGLPAAIALFAILAFLGAPQFLLIAAAVVAFGPWLGAAYSWVGTMVSALVGFWIGRAVGGETAANLRSDGIDRFMELIGRNGLLAALVVRLTPFAPFIVVNMAAGMTRMRLTDYAAGTAIGIVPKIALVAFAGGSIAAVLNGGRTPLIWPSIGGAIWIAVGLIAAKWAKSRNNLPR
jgi:uncharacterized membrane protein YdjX (TVP38/TMEM64 family)